MKIKKEIKVIMELHGYELVRKKTHLFWKRFSDGSVIVTSKTPSHKNWKYDIMRQIRKNDLQYAA